MGGGTYSTVQATATRAMKNYASKSNAQIFTERKLNSAMSPHGISLRESRDSKEHPNSLAIIIGLDVTGSMGAIPQLLIRDGLPKIMGNIIEGGEFDPQVMFLGIGDHECDQAPLQVGQFESNDEDLDKWLTTTWLENGGGGNSGESYLLAWYFAAMHTSIDCHELHGRKGLLFTIGDEPTLRDLPANALKSIMGPGQYHDFTASELLEMAQEKYEVYHIHVLSTGTGKHYAKDGSWAELLGDHLITVQATNQIVDSITAIVTNHEKAAKPHIRVDMAAEGSSDQTVVVEVKDDEILL